LKQPFDESEEMMIGTPRTTTMIIFEQLQRFSWIGLLYSEAAAFCSVDVRFWRQLAECSSQRPQACPDQHFDFDEIVRRLLGAVDVSPTVEKLLLRVCFCIPNAASPMHRCTEEVPDPL
jgi:hypothetical protein